MVDALADLERWIEDSERHYVCITTVHGVMEARKDPDLQRIMNESGLTTPDGMPLVWLAQRGGHPRVRRVYGPDLLLETASMAAEKGYRMFFYGGDEGVPEELAARLQRRFPKLLVAGCHSPPFRPLTPEEDDAVIRQINDSEPHIVWVGLSTPKQERWMAGHRAAVNAPVMVGVGAAFDFHSGRKKQAPRWMQRSGTEWVFRLQQEPRRLAKRYLVYNSQFVALISLRTVRRALARSGGADG